MYNFNNCNHTRWLRLWRKGKQIMLDASDRPRQLLKEFRNINDPTGVVVLLGNQTKTLANFKPQNSHIGRQKTNGEYHLYASYLQNKKPIIITDGDILSHNRLPRSCKPQSCHEEVNRAFMEEESSIKTIKASDDVYHRFIAPFADVVCIFVEDVGGIDNTIRRLNSWTCNGKPSTLFTRPALILVVPRGKKTQMEKAFNATFLGDHFQRVRVVTVCLITRKLRSRSVKTKPKQCIPLLKEIIKSLDMVQQSRSIAGTLFSARHLVEFLFMASNNDIRSSREPYNCIKYSRIYNPISTEFSSHLTEFLSHFDDEALQDFALPHAASCIILDQYPPGMHFFNPIDVFDNIYHDACAQASKCLETCRLAANLTVPGLDIVSFTRIKMHEMYFRCKELGSSKELQIYNLTRFYGNRVFPFSGESCFSCLRDRPMYKLPCGHWTCQTCVKIFHPPCTEDPWLYCVDRCVLCGAETAGLRIRFKPDTATPRVLSIDGGGTRGRVPLEFLRVLQDSIGLPISVQRNFDVVYGTSSGALIACALIINGWSIERCINYFEESSIKAFEKRQLFQLFFCIFGYIPILSPAFRLIMSLLVGSKYSARELEMIQQEVYGQHRGIMDSKEASEMGTFMGVTLTSTDDTNTFIATNYGDTDNDCGRNDKSDISKDYAVLKPSSGIHKVPLWEILRCCTAAPYYFTPHHIHGIGAFQDGGLTFNNPASIALKEAAALFPATPEPSIVASFGTGTTRTNHRGIRQRDGRNEQRRRWKKHRSWWKKSLAWWEDLYPARLARAVRKQWGSDNAWKQLMNHQKNSGRGEFFRFDVEFKSQLPALDNVNSMDEVAGTAREAAAESAAMRQLGRCHRAELFIFELDVSRPPRFVSGVYECVGYVLCRLRAGTVEFATFMDQLRHGSAVFKYQGRTQYLSFQGLGGIGPDGNFRQEIAFYLSSRQHQLEITLVEGSPPSICHISGSPFTLDSLMKQQNIDACFGTRDHQER
ncbi:acyl transferase/acyl hydrolase/lysophospholipase [Trichoderma barbatum]